MNLFLDWSKRFLAVSNERFVIALHLHGGQDEQERIEYWSTRTGLDLNQFRKTFFKPEGTGHRKRVLYQGTAQIRVKASGRDLCRVLGWIDGLAEIYGWDASDLHGYNSRAVLGR